MKLKIDCTGRITSTITEHFVEKITEMIQSGTISAGNRLPSIREFADQNGVSRFTVVQVYDRLVASGMLESRRGSGFYVVDTLANDKIIDDDMVTSVICKVDKNIEAVDKNSDSLSPGRGSLPPGWLEGSGLDKAIRMVGRESIHELIDGYSDISGYLPFREQVRQRLTSIGLYTTTQHILSVSGSLAGADLVCRALLNKGDVVLLDDPGYYMFIRLLKNLEIKIIGVPWNKNGPDIEKLAQLVNQHKPKMYITSAVNQNPTSITLSPSVIHQVLNIAERHNLWIMEDDVHGVFHNGEALRYAALDQLKRVIYVNSYSKTISGRLRLGYIALPDCLVERVLNKRIIGGRSSELAERVIYRLLSEGGYRKHIVSLVERLQRAREKTVKLLSPFNFEYMTMPEYGEFLWVRHSDIEDSRTIAIQAQKQSVHLVTGNHFMVDGRASPWIRFNVAWCQDPRLSEFLNSYFDH